MTKSFRGSDKPWCALAHLRISRNNFEIPGLRAEARIPG